MTQTIASAGDTPAKVFRGYDSIAKGMLNESAVTGEYEQTGGRSVVKIRVCESVGDLAQALDIDASLSVGYLKALNVTAKMEFMRKLNATAKSISIVVYSSHESGVWTAKHVKLAQGIVPPADDKAAARFVLTYGDSYVSAATQGGEYYGVYTFHTETETEKKELTASLKAKGIYTGVTAGVDVQTKLSDFLSKTSTSWSFDQEITGQANPSLPSQENMIEFARTFPSKPIDSPVTTGFKVSGYEGVPDSDGGPGIDIDAFGKVLDNRDFFLDADNGLLFDLVRVNGILSQIDWLKAIYRRYNYAGDTALADLEKKAKADQAAINTRVNAWKRNPVGKLEKPDLPSLAKGEPVLTYTVNQPASFGGERGGAFDFMPVGDALRNQVRIAGIRFADGDETIHRMMIDYVSEKARWTESHGTGGVDREKFDIDDGQFPVRFEFRVGDTVNKVAVYLADGRHTWAGSDKGAYYEWKLPEGAVVLGFAGRQGTLLDQVKIITATLKPATYR